METLELLEIIQKGESSYVQFKERIKDAHSISQEMVAFANFKGGTIIIGVNDKTGKLNGLSFQEIQKHNEMLVNAASNNIKPSLFITTEQVTINNEVLIIAKIPEGTNKPYKDKNGIIWIKNGSDKRRVTSNDELLRLLQESKNIFADEQTIPNTSINDINFNVLKYYLLKSNTEKFRDIIENDNPQTLYDFNRYELNNFLERINFANSVKKLLKNLQILSNDNLTLTGLLLFSDKLQFYRPLFTVDCVTFPENSTSTNTYTDTETIKGNYFDVFKKSIFFIERNLKKIPIGKGFNQPGKYEIPLEVFEELVVNALVHRNYYINSTIKIFIFPNRIEIISPGVLPNSLTVENIISGISIARNPTLHSLAKYILPYKGYGSGIKRALNLYPQIELKNNTSKEQFISIIKREV